MSRLRGRALAFLVALILNLGCEPSPSPDVEEWPNPPVETPAADPQRRPDSGPQITQLLDFAIFRETPNHLLVDVELFNSGRESGVVSVGGFAVDDSSSRSHTAYRPEMVPAGHHRARIWIGISSDGPDAFSTSHLRLMLYDSRTDGPHLGVLAQITVQIRRRTATQTTPGQGL